MFCILQTLAYIYADTTKKEGISILRKEISIMKQMGKNYVLLQIFSLRFNPQVKFVMLKSHRLVWKHLLIFRLITFIKTSPSCLLCSEAGILISSSYFFWFYYNLNNLYYKLCQFNFLQPISCLKMFFTHPPY